jgi:hypothetical protein
MTTNTTTAMITPTIVTTVAVEENGLGAADDGVVDVGGVVDVDDVVVDVGGGELTTCSCTKVGVIDLSNNVSPSLPCHTANAT